MLTISPPKKSEVHLKSNSSSSSSSSVEYFTPEELDDYELLYRMCSSRNGNAIRLLFNGDISGYSSQSEADLALVSHLALDEWRLF